MIPERLKEKLGFGVLLTATLVVVVPVLFIIWLIVSKGWSALSWNFLFTMPREGMREGGIFRGDEAVRLRVVCQRPTYLYVVAKDGKGQTAVLYPKAPGEALAIGEDRAVPAGEWCFPKSVNGHDGLLYDPLEAQGTESFVVIAAEKQVADLPALLAGLTKSANAVATRDPTAGRGDWSFDLVSRNPVGFVKVENATAGDLPVPVFAGVGAATIVKTNLTRVPAR